MYEIIYIYSYQYSFAMSVGYNYIILTNDFHEQIYFIYKQYVI